MFGTPLMLVLPSTITDVMAFDLLINKRLQTRPPHAITQIVSLCLRLWQLGLETLGSIRSLRIGRMRGRVKGKARHRMSGGWFTNRC